MSPVRRNFSPATRYPAIDIAVGIVLLIASLLIPWSFLREGKALTHRSFSLSFADASSEPPFSKEGELTFLSKKGTNKIITIDIEIADTDYERTRGLMHRRALPADAGMLFIFDRAEVRSFWMRNTYIPLDILFIDERKRVVAIAKRTEPLSYTPISSLRKAQYVVEVNAGFCDEHGISLGDRIAYRTLIPRHRVPSP